jgi:predicted MFS family arabinose efflux permease
MLSSMRQKLAIVTLMLVAVAFIGPWSRADAISKGVALTPMYVALAFMGPWSRAFATIAGCISMIVATAVGAPEDAEDWGALALFWFGVGVVAGALFGALINRLVKTGASSWTRRLPSS